MIRRHIVALRALLMGADLASSTLLFLAIAELRFGAEWRQVWIGSGVAAPIAAAAFGGAWSTSWRLSATWRVQISSIADRATRLCTRCQSPRSATKR